MDFNEYQYETRKTWIVNKHDFIRVILGICGESGEIAEKIKKYYRGDIDCLVIQQEIKNELGDLMYYIAQMANHLNWNLEEIAKENIEKLQSRKQRGKLKGEGDNR